MIANGLKNQASFRLRDSEAEEQTDGQNDPDEIERRTAVGVEFEAEEFQLRQVRYAVEAASITLLIDDQQVHHDQPGQSDDRDIDTGDAPFEYEPTKGRRGKHRNRNPGKDRKS